MRRVLAWSTFLTLVLLAAQAWPATIGLGSLPQGAVLSTQLQSQGLVFVPYYGVSGITGTAPAGTIATFDYAPGIEFPPSGAKVQLTALHALVGAHVGLIPNTGPTVMTLTAFDSSGQVIGTSVATVTPASGFSTQLQYSSASANIASFTVVPTLDANTSPLAVLDFTLDNGSTSPDFAIGTPTYVTLVAGQIVDVPVTIERLGGSAGPVSLSVASLNAGVVGVFIPDPVSATGNLVLSALGDAPQSVQTVTITGTPTSATVGPVAHTAQLVVSVATPVEVSGSAQIDLSTCNQGGPVGTVTRTFFVQREGTIAPPIDVTIEGLPPNVTATVTPPQLTFPGSITGEGFTVTFTTVAGLPSPDAMASIHLTGTGVDQRFAILITGTCPRHQMDFVVRGAWLCDNRGAIVPMQHAVVEFFRHRSDWYDDKVGEVVTAPDGSYTIALWASEPGDYYARFHTDDHLGAHLNDWWESSFWSIDSEHISNTNPLIDFGSIVIWRDDGAGTPKCAIWDGAHQAHEELNRTVDPGHQAYWPVYDYSIVLQNTPGLTPWSELQTTNWPDDYETAGAQDAQGGDPLFVRYEGSIHEFGHCIRQTLDGDYTHFSNDNSLYTYARPHSYCTGPEYGEANGGFAFNEGWAEYWSNENFRCFADTSNMDIEGDVGNDLFVLSQCPGVGRRGMVRVLDWAGPDSIHSDAEFRRHYLSLYPQCPIPSPVVGGGGGCSGTSSASSRAQPMRFRDPKPQIAKLEHALAAQREATASLQAQRATAVKRAENPGPCEGTCQRVASTLAAPSALAGKIELSKMLEERYAGDLGALRAGIDPRTMFDPRAALERRRVLLAFDGARRRHAHDALADAVTAIRARERDYPQGDLPRYRSELERQAKLLEARTVRDDSLVSFVSVRGAAERDSLQKYPFGTKFPIGPTSKPPRWGIALMVGFVVFLMLAFWGAWTWTPRGTR